MWASAKACPKAIGTTGDGQVLPETLLCESSGRASRPDLNKGDRRNLSAPHRIPATNKGAVTMAHTHHKQLDSDGAIAEPASPDQSVATVLHTGGLHFASE